jgi:glutaminase
MSTRRNENEISLSPYVSTGHLPVSEVIKKLAKEAYKRFESDKQGQNSQVYPALCLFLDDFIT